MTKLPSVSVATAMAAEAFLRHVTLLPVRSTAVRLLTARVVGPALTAIERFLDARAEAFSARASI